VKTILYAKEKEAGTAIVLEMAKECQVMLPPKIITAN
jgi:hypothetical protein